jgi:hypothetical protein
MNYKTINSMVMIYILPAPAKTLGMPARPSGKFSKKLKIRLTPNGGVCLASAKFEQK